MRAAAGTLANQNSQQNSSAPHAARASAAFPVGREASLRPAMGARNQTGRLSHGSPKTTPYVPAHSCRISDEPNLSGNQQDDQSLCKSGARWRGVLVF